MDLWVCLIMGFLSTKTTVFERILYIGMDKLKNCENLALKTHLYGKYIFSDDLEKEPKAPPENLDQTPSTNVIAKTEGYGTAYDTPNDGKTVESPARPHKDFVVNDLT